MTKAMFAFSADPIHRGHIDIIKRAAALFEEVVVGIGVNPDKNCMFSLEERVEMAKKALQDIPNVKLTAYDGLTVDYAYENNIPVIVKGVRSLNDFDYEMGIEDIQKSQNLGIETFPLFGRKELAHISSSSAKAVQKEHGLIHEYVPLHIKQKLEERISGQYVIGVTGEIGSGKSYVSEKFEELGKQKGIKVYNLDLDKIAHEILEERKEPKYQEVRDNIAKTFGEEVKLPAGIINRKALGDIVFNDYSKLQKLNELMHTPILVRFRRELYDKKGLILLNAALIAEGGWGYLCNNNVVLVDVDKASQERRLKERKVEGKALTVEQIQRRLGSQYNFAKKREELEEAISKDKYGKLWLIDNSDNSNPAEIEKTFDNVVKEMGVK